MAAKWATRALCRTSASKHASTAPLYARPVCLRPPISGASRSIREFSIARPLREKYYTESHEWIELSADKKTGTVGISSHAASALGDVVFVELPAENHELNAGDTMGAVESVKSASDLYAPVGGKIILTNSQLEETPGLINKSPENDGWITKIDLKEGEAQRVEAKDGFMMAEDYKKFTE